MSHLVLLLAHPRPDSYCHALAERIGEQLVERGHEVRSHDLYAERFDPILTSYESHTSGPDIEGALAREEDPLIALHREELRQASGLAIVHPNWWGMPPAILTGWIDRVVVPGVAYRLKDATGRPEPLAPIERLLVINTSDTTDEREELLYGDPLASIWGRCVAPYLGSPQVTRRVLRPVSSASDEQRAAWLDEVGSLAAETFGAVS
ncbi:NAD(P)H-dependent oxidoreductase [Aeromicrobium wangtongii]|uniref:NAD(P)H-dependent oxidoreductase n=1 Tax=Aeromicrobium wangtongii TaxID=2969247 RepID=A0ABY5M569_9ACTN|nr:NAD(P)H-dependent oxidoreductase [Aeromicrobium wangtongii]MCD9198267.1 NAD(P)H-dependent oxidoreductase [Aeromicrobium wangtongii]UUP12301.1 NAD(P)H-dependent oxidoreductase [Aeromicrobium wangtongii]